MRKELSAEKQWRKRRGEQGQTMLFVLLAIGLFLLASVAFAVDVANLWFHRQTAQNAADAACTAGAMDLLVTAQGGTVPSANFTPGTGFNCATKASASPCKYAVLNGYDGAGLVPATASNDVAVSFPPQSANPAPGVTPAPVSMAPVSFIRVDVIDRVKVFFMALLTGGKTQDVRAFAVCGLTLAKSPIPILVLDPVNPPKSSAMDNSGTGNTPKISILGGPHLSIQVNSDDPQAVNFSGGAQINLTKGGPNFDGSSFGVFGGPATVSTTNFLTAGTGTWISPSTPIGDPFAQIAAPPKPAAPSSIPLHTITPACMITVGCPTYGCPDFANGCVHYGPGYYSSGIQVKNITAIFDPGVYYLNGGLQLQSNSLVRPSSQIGDGSGGTFFYLTGTPAGTCSGQNGLACVGSNAGSPTVCSPAIYTTPSINPKCVNPFDSSLVQCPGGPAPDPRLNLPPALPGNVLLAPCTGTYGDPLGQYRGLLFFQDRSTAAGGGWGGGGGFLLAGSMYFHQCNASGTGTGCGAAGTDYNALFTLQGNSGSASYILGEIVTDNLAMGGTPNINMALNPYASYSILKVSLLR